MKSKTLLSILVLAGSLSLMVGCDSDDDNKPEGKYSSGAFVINEGNFGSGNGDVTFFQSPSDVEDAIYKNTNGDFAGDGLQSITFHDDEVFLVLNADNKIEIADGNTFEYKATISDEDIFNPRYLTAIDGNAYLSVWGPYDENYALVDSYILVIDVNSREIVDKIDTDEGVERLVYNGEYLFASNFGYGASNTVAIIDPSDNTLVDQIEVGWAPEGMVLDVNDNLWVMCNGTFGGNDGALYRINTSTLEVEDSYPLGLNPSGDLVISADGETLFYNVSNTIYKMSVNDEAVPDEPIVTQNDATSFYGLGFDAENEVLYAGDDRGFTSVGIVYRYTEDGTFIDQFNCGIGPNGFVFK